MNIVHYALLGLFGAKLLWNIFAPAMMELLRNRWRKAKSNSPKSMSMATFVEVFTLLMMVITAVLSKKFLEFGPLDVFLLGGGAILTSYVLAVYLARIVRYFCKFRP